MDDSNTGKMQKDESDPMEARKSDATSKETLSDVERDEKASNPNSSGDQTSVPSPDGTPDPGRGGRADGSETGGPM